MVDSGVRAGCMELCKGWVVGGGFKVKWKMGVGKSGVWLVVEGFGIVPEVGVTFLLGRVWSDGSFSCIFEAYH